MPGLTIKTLELGEVGHTLLTAWRQEIYTANPDLSEPKVRSMTALRLMKLTGAQIYALADYPSLLRKITFNKTPAEIDELITEYTARSRMAITRLAEVIFEKTNIFLRSLSNPKDIEELNSFFELNHRLKIEGVDVIWDEIKNQVLKKIDPENELGLEWLEKRKNVANLRLVENIQSFQAEIIASLGYRQYCQRAIIRTGFFSSSTLTRKEILFACIRDIINSDSMMQPD